VPKSAEEILQELKQAGGASATSASPLGVPPGYTAPGALVDPEEDYFARGGIGPRQPNPPRVMQPPRYFEGDEWSPASQSPEVVARIQRDMADAGLFDDNDEITIGAWDATTRAAYRSLLSYANASGLAAPDAIVRLKEITASGGGRVKALSGDAAGVRVSSPLEIRAVADKAAQSVIGRRLNDSEAAAVVGAFQGLQSAEPTSSTDAPPLDVFTEDYLRRSQPGEVAQMDTLGYANDFFSLLQETGG
jgi:hypothetical protein